MWRLYQDCSGTETKTNCLLNIIMQVNGFLQSVIYYIYFLCMSQKINMEM